MPPRALSPSGLFLIDKPDGPSSFAIVAEVRRRTGARTGHAGTLDPFATGLLLVLSGAATKLASSFVGLDKRYLTEVDLAARTDTGDREGEIVERLEPPERRGARAARRGAARRGRAAGPGGLGREDRRRARLPAAPPRRGGRDADPPLAGRRSWRSSPTRTASPGSTSASAPAPTCARSPTSWVGTARRCGARRWGRSTWRRPTPSGSSRRTRRWRGSAREGRTQPGRARAAAACRRDRDLRRRPPRPPGRARSCRRLRASSRPPSPSSPTRASRSGTRSSC